MVPPVGASRSAFAATFSREKISNWDMGARNIYLAFITIMNLECQLFKKEFPYECTQNKAWYDLRWSLDDDKKQPATLASIKAARRGNLVVLCFKKPNRLFLCSNLRQQPESAMLRALFSLVTSCVAALVKKGIRKKQTSLMNVRKDNFCSSSHAALREQWAISRPCGSLAWRN